MNKLIIFFFGVLILSCKNAEHKNHANQFNFDEENQFDFTIYKIANRYSENQYLYIDFIKKNKDTLFFSINYINGKKVGSKNLPDKIFKIEKKWIFVKTKNDVTNKKEIIEFLEKNSLFKKNIDF